MSYADTVRPDAAATMDEIMRETAAIALDERIGDLMSWKLRSEELAPAEALQHVDAAIASLKRALDGMNLR